MSTPPLVSVIMPLYNKRPFVKRAIESVQQQTFPHWELIIVDDGSDDGSTYEIPRNDARIRLIHQGNKGPGAARNRGIEAAEGELVTFLDADDFYYPHKMTEEVKLIWSEQRAEWMISAFEHMVGSELHSRFLKNGNGNELRGEPIVVENAFERVQVSGWHIDGFCIKKKLLERIGGFNENMRCYEITEFNIRCVLRQPKGIMYLDPLYRVIDVMNSTFKMVWNRIDGKRQIGESLHRLSADHPEYERNLADRSREALFSYITSLIMVNRRVDARRYLLDKYPFARNRRWLKMWIGSLLPYQLVKRLVTTDTDI